MKNVKKIFDEIKSTSGKLAKEAILLREKDNDKFKKVLQFLLNPFVITGISTQKIKKVINGEFANKTNDIFQYLTINNTGRDVDILTVQTYISNQPKELQGFYENVITKNLKLGIDAKTVNKVYGKGFIPVFDVMLGTSIEHCKLPEGTWFSISHKLNGNRCVWYKGKLYTRQGKEYTGLDHIVREIKNIQKLFDCDMVFDGELVYKNPEKLTDSEAFRKGTGIAQSNDEDKSDLRFIIFDMLPVTEFESGISSLSYSKRLAELERLENYILLDLHSDDVLVVDRFYFGINQKRIWECLDYAEKKDLEGIILNLDAPYQCKRTKDLIKVKKFYTVDLKIIGYEEGTGKFKGTLGSLVVDYKGNQVKVGSGLDDNTRHSLWEHKDELLGKIVEVKYKEISKDKKTNKESLQFPIFIRIRNDKDTVSYE